MHSFAEAIRASVPFPQNTREEIRGHWPVMHNLIHRMAGFAGRMLERRPGDLSHRGATQPPHELLDLLPVGVYVCDADGRILQYNRRACELWGREPRLLDPDETFCGSLKLLTPDGEVLPHGEAPMARAVRTQQPQHDQEVVIERPDGSRAFALVNIDPLFDAHGRFIGAVNCFQDITRQKHYEATLREGDERLRFTLESARVGTWNWNIRSGEVSWSENLCELHGLAPETFQGTFYDFAHNVHPEDRDSLVEALQHALETDGAYHVEYRVNPPDASLRWLEGKGRVIHEDTGAAVAMTGICMDITERRLLEDRFRVAVEASPSAFVMVDSAGRINLVNSQSERIFGYTRSEMLGQVVEMLVPERFRGAHPHLRNRYHDQPTARAMGAGRDLYCLRKDGTEFPVEIGLSPIKMPEDTFVLSAIVDITERKRAEDAIKRVNEDLRQKNQEMEQFVYTVSHDLKSPIVTTMGFLGMLREDLETDDKEQMLDSIQRIERAAKRMSQLIDDLLQLSRIGRLFTEPEPVDVAALLHEMIDDLADRIDRAGAVVRVQPGMPVVMVDRKRFADVLENLITNALKYGCSMPEPVIEIGGCVEDGEVRFFVRDYGIGIAEEYHNQIFGLFQRLSNDQQGTGVGLAIVARVVEVHGGRVWVESIPGAGATFWIGLPQQRVAV
jgi:two-component system, LuxR family, sensor kinase FixL